MTDNNVLVGDVLQTAMYFMGPFFANPAKPVLQQLWCRTGYTVAYKHFKRDHTKPLNLALHGVALCAQVSSNFACLHRLDELLGSPSWGWLSASTAVLWSGLLLPQRAPIKARALAVALIATCYLIRKKLVEKSDWLLYGSSIVEAFNFRQYFRLAIPKGLRDTVAPEKSAVVRYLLARLSVTAALMGSQKEASAFLSKKVAGVILTPLLLWASYKPFYRQGYRKTLLGNVVTINSYHFLGWLMYLLTGEKLFFLHSAAFSAGGIQGIAHDLAAEEGTLPQLNDSHYEFAHCTYFPLLALHRIFEHLGNRALVVARAAARQAA